MMPLVIRACVAGLALLAPISAIAAEPERWLPPAGLTFSIILSVAPNVIDTPADVVDVDLFDISTQTVAALKAQKKRVVCYMSAGSWENWRPDKNDFPEGVKGKKYDGWAGERWLDTRNLAVLGPLMRARLDRCKQKGFDGDFFLGLRQGELQTDDGAFRQRGRGVDGNAAFADVLRQGDEREAAGLCFDLGDEGHAASFSSRLHHVLQEVSGVRFT